MENPATSVTSSLWASLNSWFTSTVFFVLLNLMIATIVFTSNLPDNNNNQQQQEQEQEQQDPKKPPQIARSPSLLHRLKSFNFSPQKTHQDPDSEPHYHQHPLELAASQYVFSQPLEYQHYDFDPSNPDQPHQLQPRTIETQTRAEHVTEGYESYEQTRIQTRVDAGSDLDPTRKQTRRNVAFDLDPTRQEQEKFGFDPTRPGSVFDKSDEEQFESLDEVYSKLKTGGHDRTKSDGSITTKPAAKMKKSASLKVGFVHLEEEEIVEARRPATVKEKKTAVKVVDDDDVEVDSRADDFINKFKNDLKLQRIESIIRTKGAMNRGGGK